MQTTSISLVYISVSGNDSYWLRSHLAPLHRWAGLQWVSPQMCHRQFTPAAPSGFSYLTRTIMRSWLTVINVQVDEDKLEPGSLFKVVRSKGEKAHSNMREGQLKSWKLACCGVWLLWWSVSGWGDAAARGGSFRAVKSKQIKMFLFSVHIFYTLGSEMYLFQHQEMWTKNKFGLRVNKYRVESQGVYHKHDELWNKLL